MSLTRWPKSFSSFACVPRMAPSTIFHSPLPMTCQPWRVLPFHSGRQFSAARAAAKATTRARVVNKARVVHVLGEDILDAITAEGVAEGIREHDLGGLAVAFASH